MTIVACVKVRDGLILATDSVTTISGQAGVVKTYSNARKLFEISRHPVGVMTYGLGNVGERSIEGLVFDFCDGLPDDRQRSVEELAKSLYSFVKELYEEEFKALKEADRPPLGFLLAGYSPGKPLPEEYEFEIPMDAAPKSVRPPDQFGASWRGVTGPFTRLYKGFEPQAMDALKSGGVTDGAFDAALAGQEMAVIYNGMPVQDAINFAVFILETTIGYVAFEMGPDACGPPLQVATVLPDDGFQWIAKPELRVP